MNTKSKRSGSTNLPLRTMTTLAIVLFSEGAGPTSPVTMAAPLAATAADYTKHIRPLVKTYCLGCHSAKEMKGELDLERFATLEQVSADVEPWQYVLKTLESNEMPPEGKPRPRREELRLMTGWIRSFLEQEALVQDGDPGRALIRRLNNAEYDYTIRDLTGVDLRPARQFPSDGAAGEGFLNAHDALAISPELMVKYLDAAKETAAHAVLLPDGFRFSAAKFREDWVNEVLAEINAIHRRYATEHGEIPTDQYLKATLVHRDAIRSGKTPFAQVASAEKLAPVYLQILWQMMNEDRPSILLNALRAKWNKAMPTDVPSLAADIRALQGLLWHKREPRGAHALEDRFVPAAVALTDRHKYKLDFPEPGEEVVFYLAAQTLADRENHARILLERPRFESGDQPPLLLCDALEMTSLTEPDQTPAPTQGVSRLELAQFGRHPSKQDFNPKSLLLQRSEVLEVRLPGSLVSQRTFVVDVRLDPGNSPETLVRFDVRRTPVPPQVDRSLMWQYREGESASQILVLRNDDAIRQAFAKSADEFRRVFPARVCYPGVIVRDTIVTLERFHRGDGHLSRLLLSPQEHTRLDRLWEELHFISRDALQVWESLSTLTQGEMTAYKQVQREIDRRAKQTEKDLLASESRQLDSLLDFAARAYRRPLTAQKQQTLRDFYRSLRESELPHDETFRSVLARVLVSPTFLFRIEQAQPGKEPKPVSDWELATRLSFFLWASIPDEKLRQAAAAGRLQDPQVLAQQTHRMLRDSRSRALAIEFGTQWLEVRGLDQFEGKNQELFPTFNAELRQAMYEESILFVQDLFQSDQPISQLIDADHTFLNETLANHYGIPSVKGDQFRRVNGVKKHGRGGMLGLGSVLSKHSGASRTSPVLRGNWIAEIVLGDKLPRPPDGVPKLPEAETDGNLTIRQLVEKHAEVQQCAVCHERIDPLGFALEQFDTIGRRRDQDLGGRPIDAGANLKDGTHFEGIDGLRQYLLTQRKDDLVRQFCRKLLGYALGCRVVFSDRQLLKEMAAELNQDDGRLSDVVQAVVRSKQFRFIRGSDFAKNK